MSKHTVSKEDIDALFEGETIVLNGGNASDLVQNGDNSSTKDETTRETISIKGAKTLVEEVAKKLPKITMD